MDDKGSDEMCLSL